MKIDAHQHFWRYDPDRDRCITERMERLKRDFLPEELMEELARNEIEGSIAVQADQSERETRFLLQLAERPREIKGVVGWVDLRAPDVGERLHSLSQIPKLVGFRHIVQSEPDDRFLLRQDFCRGIRPLAACDFTYDILIYPRQLPAAIELARMFPEQRFLLDHLAKPPIKTGPIAEWAAQIRALAEQPNVYAKLSGPVTEADGDHWQESDAPPYLDVALEAFGADRLLFGSDWPVCLLAGSYRRVKSLIGLHPGADDRRTTEDFRAQCHLLLPAQRV
jgi:L-fuconolactonase